MSMYKEVDKAKLRLDWGGGNVLKKSVIIGLLLGSVFSVSRAAGPNYLFDKFGPVDEASKLPTPFTPLPRAEHVGRLFKPSAELRKQDRRETGSSGNGRKRHRIGTASSPFRLQVCRRCHKTAPPNSAEWSNASGGPGFTNLKSGVLFSAFVLLFRSYMGRPKERAAAL